MERLKLKKDLTLLGKVISKTNALPILDNILITPEYIYATDLITSITIHKYTGVKENILVNFKDLRQIINEFKSKSVEFKKVDDKVEIKCNGATIITHPDDIADYPEEMDDEFIFAETLYTPDIEEVKIAKAFTEDNELRPVLESVFIDKENIISTNGKTLHIAKKTFPYTSSYFIHKDIVPLINSANQLKVYTGQEKMKFEYDNISIIIKKETEKFPDYKAVLPKENDIKFRVIISTEKLMEICKAIKPYHPLSAFCFSEDKVKIENIDLDSGREISAEIPYKGKVPEVNTEFRVEVSHLLTCLKSIDTTTVKMDIYHRNIVMLNDSTLIMYQNI